MRYGLVDLKSKARNNMGLKLKKQKERCEQETSFTIFFESTGTVTNNIRNRMIINLG